VSKRILIVEDEANIVVSLEFLLGQEGHQVKVATSGEEALALFPEYRPDLVLLDVMLPGIDGFETCRRLRGNGVAVPVLMLTARESVEDRVAGLDSGADDYMMKPFAFAELLARLRALRRRGVPAREDVIQVDDLRLDPVSRRVDRDGTEILLSPTEYAVLEALMRRPEQVVSRDALIESVWGLEREARSNIVDVYIKHLRHKIDEPFGRRSLETVRGAGYRLRMTAGR